MSRTIEELLPLAKEVLSIIPTATAKDNEIRMLINSAIKDMDRLDIDTENKISDELVKCAIMMYVKANFGNTNEKEKMLCQKSYSLFLSNLANTSEYLKGGTNDWFRMYPH